MADARIPYGPYALLCPRCGDVFYWLKSRWDPLTILQANICVHTDGTAVERREIMICGSCGQAPPSGEFGNVGRFAEDAVVASETLSRA